MKTPNIYDIIVFFGVIFFCLYFLKGLLSSLHKWIKKFQYIEKKEDNEYIDIVFLLKNLGDKVYENVSILIDNKLENVSGTINISGDNVGGKNIDYEEFQQIRQSINHFSFDKISLFSDGEYKNIQISEEIDFINNIEPRHYKMYKLYSGIKIKPNVINGLVFGQKAAQINDQTGLLKIYKDDNIVLKQLHPKTCYIFSARTHKNKYMYQYHYALPWQSKFWKLLFCY